MSKPVAFVYVSNLRWGGRLGGSASVAVRGVGVVRERHVRERP